MSGEEDEKEYELKDLIVQTLEANGILPKIKAQIRANVFMALDQTDKKKPNSNSQMSNVAVNRVLASNEGRTSAALVKDFLEKTNLEYTLAVFDPELNSPNVLDRRENLVDSFKLNEKTSTKDFPLLMEVIKLVNSSSSREIKSENISQGLVDAIKAKFDYIDVNRKGLIDEEKARNLFADFFPHFSRSVIDAFLNDEFNNSDILRGVEYQKLLSIFKKWYFQCQRTFSTTEQELTTNSHKSIPTNGTSKKPDDPFDSLDFGSFKKESSKEELKKTSNFSNGLSSLGDLPPLNGSNQNKKTLNSLNKELDRRFKDADDDNYDEDFTSGTTPRTPNQDRKVTKSRGGMVSDEDVEENLSYIEESSKIDEFTVDKSISTIQNNDADYIEDLSI